MRHTEFPFAKHRNWQETPDSLPDLDTEALSKLGHWQENVYNKPVFDDITAYPNFYPSTDAARNYTTRPTKRTLLKKTPDELGISEEDWQSRIERQPLHVAKSAELATAISWTAARLRAVSLNRAIGRVSSWGEVEGSQDVLIIEEDDAVIAADAIADYGYTLAHPVDLDHRGVDYGKPLGKRIRQEAGGIDIGSALERFGLFAGVKPEVLQSADGVTAMEITQAEQDRRIKHWGERHGAITRAYPNISISREILEEHLPLHKIIEFSNEEFEQR